jgi:hypothetical protein
VIATATMPTNASLLFSRDILRSLSLLIIAVLRVRRNASTPQHGNQKNLGAAA